MSRTRAFLVALAALLPLPLLAQPAGVPARTDTYVESFDRGPPEQMLGGRLTVGTAGAWTGAVVDGSYVLANRTEPSALRFLYMNELPVGPNLATDPVVVEAEVTFRSDDDLSGAGIAVRVADPAQTYQVFLIGPKGYAVVHRTSEGVSVPLRGTIGGIPTDRPVRVTARVGGDGTQFLVEGRSIATLGHPDLKGTAVGIGALGRGEFRFHRFAVAPAGGAQPARPPMVQQPAPPAGPQAGGSGMFDQFRSQFGVDTPRPGMPAAPPARIALQPQGERGWFSIGLPQGWRVVGDRASGHIAAMGDRSSIHIRPFFLPGAGGEAAVRGILAAHARDVAERTQWSGIQRFSHDGRFGLRAVGVEGGFRRLAAVGVVPTHEGIAGIFWLVSAPQESFAASAPLFGAILESFRPEPGRDPGPGAGGPSPQRLAFQRWVDPNEGSFSTEVPAGWRVTGGTVRASAVDVRSMVKVESPDGAITCSIGDAEMPPFVEPTGGMQEGTWYNPMASAMYVQRYLPGEHFARFYADFRLKGVVEAAQIDVARPLPDAMRAANALLQQYGGGGGAIQLRADIGEVHGRARFRGQPARFYVYASTQRTGMQGVGGQWNVTGVMSLLATEDRVGEAVFVLTRMLQTAQVNPEWAARQQQTTAIVSRITAETNRHVSNIISQSYADQQARYERIFNQGSIARREVVRLVDPQTGDGYEVQAGSNYHWITDQGVIVGTNSHWNPSGLYFREMLQVAP